MSRTFDSIIIGWGQAGPFLAARLARAWQTVALVELPTERLQRKQ